MQSESIAQSATQVWCVPCNMEEKNELHWRWSAMQPAGQILSLLLDGNTRGRPPR
jgi:hypothetical protein